MGKQISLADFRTELKTLIGETVANQVAEAIEPYKAQATQWQKQLELVKTPALVNPFAKSGLLGGFVRSLAAGKGDVAKAIAFADKTWQSDNDVTKALSAGDATAGGFLVPTQVSDELIELLRPRSVIRKLGPTIVPMDTGVIEIPKITGGATASYIGENENIPTSQETFGMLRLTWKKLAAIVPISNDLLRFSNPSADTIVRNDLVAAVAQREDSAFLRDNGTDHTPKGIRHWIPSANVIPVNATVNLANITSDLSKAVLALENANARMISPAWIMAPRTAMFLMTIRDANGNFQYRDEMSGPNGTLWGFPFATTTQIPINLGGGGNESEIYLVDMADVILGEASNVMIDVSNEAAYVENGVVVSAFSRDQTLMRVITHHDIGLRYDAAGVVLTEVDWIP